MCPFPQTEVMGVKGTFYFSLRFWCKIDYSVISEKAGVCEKSFSKGQILLRGYDREDEIMIVTKEMIEDVAMRLR